jgi:hypothetical protein
LRPFAVLRNHPLLTALSTGVLLLGAFIIVSAVSGAQWPVALAMCMVVAAPGAKIWPARAWAWGLVVSSAFALFLAAVSVALAMDDEFSWVPVALAVGFPACAGLSAALGSRLLASIARGSE